MQWCSSSAKWHSAHLLLLHYINPISVGSRQTWDHRLGDLPSLFVSQCSFLLRVLDPNCWFCFVMFSGLHIKPDETTNIWWLIKGIRILSSCKYKAEAIWTFTQPSFQLPACQLETAVTFVLFMSVSIISWLSLILLVIFKHGHQRFVQILSFSLQDAGYEGLGR